MGSLPARGAWIEIFTTKEFNYENQSLPARGAWIEIKYPVFVRTSTRVAPRTGSVD